MHKDLREQRSRKVLVYDHLFIPNNLMQKTTDRFEMLKFWLPQNFITKIHTADSVRITELLKQRQMWNVLMECVNKDAQKKKGTFNLCILMDGAVEGTTDIKSLARQLPSMDICK